MVQQVVGTCMAGLAESLITQERDAWAESSTESSFAEMLAELVHVERVAVDSNFFDDLGADSMVMAQFCARVRKRSDLPAVSIKDVYQHPTIASLATALTDAAPVPLERVLADVLADVVRAERVSVDSNFFDDLGADSMVMAQFCARVRKRPDLPSVSIKDIYQHPTIASLAAALTDAAPVPVESPAPAPVEVAKRAGTRQVFLCGALQLVAFFVYISLAALVMAQGYDWISAGSGVLDIYLRSVISGCALFLFLFTVPILAKWILIGRWKPKQIRIWSLAYVRFWVVKTLVRRNPIVLFTGSPLFTLYLRALGAKVGRGVVIFSTHVPICTDLLTIGEGTVIRKDCFINGYRAHAGFIQVGPITIGKNVVISEATVIDIETSMGDGTQLGHASSLHSGQAVPDGERWHGTPGQQTEADFLTVEPAPSGTLRRAAYAIWQLLTLLLVYLPVGIGGSALLLLKVPRLNELMGEGTSAYTSWTFYRDALIVSSVLYLGSVAAGFIIVMTVPRLLNLALKPDKLYRLYGFHYGIHRWIVRFSNAKFLSNIVGDSSWIVNYLRGIGYDLGKVVQMGANFGGNVKHENPYPELRRQRNDGRRRAVDDECRVLEHVFPVVPGVHRGAQLPRQRHRVSAARQDGRQLPARDEGHGADQRAHPGECRAAGLPALRDPEVGRARQQLRPPEAGGRVPPRPRRQEQAQPRHHFLVPVRPVDVLPSAFHPHGHCRGPLRRIGCGGDRVGTPAHPALRCCLLDPGRSDRERLQASARAVLLDLRACDVAPRTVLEGALDRIYRGLRRHPVYQHDPAPNGCPDWPSGFQ